MKLLYTISILTAISHLFQAASGNQQQQSTKQNLNPYTLLLGANKRPDNPKIQNNPTIYLDLQQKNGKRGYTSTACYGLGK